VVDRIFKYIHQWLDPLWGLFLAYWVLFWQPNVTISRLQLNSYRQTKRGLGHFLLMGALVTAGNTLITRIVMFLASFVGGDNPDEWRPDHIFLDDYFNFVLLSLLFLTPCGFILSILTASSKRKDKKLVSGFNIWITSFTMFWLFAYVSINILAILLFVVPIGVCPSESLQTACNLYSVVYDWRLPFYIVAFSIGLIASWSLVVLIKMTKQTYKISYLYSSCACAFSLIGLVPGQFLFYPINHLYFEDVRPFFQIVW
jgi:hypothetical protein